MSDQSSQERERINNFVDVQGIRGIALPSSIGWRRAKRNSETESNEYAMSPPAHWSVHNNTHRQNSKFNKRRWAGRAYIYRRIAGHLRLNPKSEKPPEI